MQPQLLIEVNALKDLQRVNSAYALGELSWLEIDEQEI